MNFVGKSSAKTISFHDGEVRLSGGEIMRDLDRHPSDPTCSIADIHLDKAALVIDEGVSPAEAIDLLRTMLQELQHSFE